MEKKEFVYLPESLAKKIKDLENKDELIEKEVLCYIEKTKKDISNQVELLDDDILLFKGKLVSYKKAFKEAYSSADEEMYSFWEELDKKLSHRYKALNTRLERVSSLFDREYEKKAHKIDSLYKKMENINTYKFEKLIFFLRSFDTLTEESKSLFIELLKKEK